MNEEKDIVDIGKLKILSVKNIIKILLKAPEVPIEEIERLFNGSKITLTHVSSTLFLIEAKNIPHEEYEKTDREVCEIVDKIKVLQIEYYDNKENREKIPIPDQITSEIAKFIVEANKKGTYDADKVALVLQNILGDIYKHPELDTAFLDRKSIEYFAKASVSKIMDEAKLNLNDALKEIAINIRKLFLVWIYDQCRITILNYETDRTDVPLIQKNDMITIGNKQYQKISLPQRYEDRLEILYDVDSHSIITSNFGKDKIKQIMPFIYITIFDQISFHIALESLEIERSAFENIERSIIQDLNKIDPFDKTTIEDLTSFKNGLMDASDFFCKLLNNQVNRLKSQNREIKSYYRMDYHRMLAYRLLRGPISQKILQFTPLRDIDELDKTALKLEKMSYRFSALSSYIVEKMNSLIQAKKENNPTLFEKIVKEIREYSLDFFAKYAAEMSKP